MSVYDLPYMKRLAVIGGGFAGLGLAWHWLRAGRGEVTIFDPNGIGQGASGISTGLLHPFPGRQALRSWRATEGMEAARELIEASERALGRDVAERNGVLRLVADRAQEEMFRRRAHEDREVTWWEPEQVQDKIPHAAKVPGLWIPDGITVYSSLYLEGLWKSCKERGAHLERTKVHSLQDLHSYDHIVLATGSSTLDFPECNHLPLEPVKGQTLLCRWPSKLPCSLSANGHITPTEDPNLCQIGSTYEKPVLNSFPDPSLIPTLLEKAAQFYPPARHFPVVEQRAAIRMAVKHNQYRPLVQKIAANAWVFTGLGSRGLLYHALLGRELALNC